MGSILATDMAKHFDDLANFKRQLEISGIKKELGNGINFIDRKDAKTIFQS